MRSYSRAMWKVVVLIGRRICISLMPDESGNGTAGNAIWAVAMIIIVAMIAGVVYYSGILKGGSQKKEVDIDVTLPSR
jgi:hypothetical protein